MFVEWSELKKVHVEEYFLDGGFRHRHINSIWFDEDQKVVPSLLWLLLCVCVYASMKFACTAYILYTCNVACIGNAVYLGKIMPRWITHFNSPQKGCFCTVSSCSVGRVVIDLFHQILRHASKVSTFGVFQFTIFHFSCWKVFGLGRELPEFLCHRFPKNPLGYGICFLRRHLKAFRKKAYIWSLKISYHEWY